jgi:hypothetical protein
MSDADELTYDELLNQVVEVAHPFEIDLRSVVLNHRLTLEAIIKLEDYGLSEVKEALADEDPGHVSSAISWQEKFYDDLRTAANHLAAVGLVTRFQRWISRWVNQRDIQLPKSHDSRLIKELCALNNAVGASGPVPVAFFEDLVTARDSVIHGDSKAEWSFNGKPRRVADHYRNAWNELELTEDHLKDAIAKAIAQVKWYDERLASSP